MEQDKDRDEKENNHNKKDGWIDKTEAYIDETAEKIHQSNTYRKAGKSAEDVTRKLFRKAGRWWGKSEKYFKK
jgi:hypothetical protein